MLDCLSNLVGLTNKDCGCYDGSKPTGFDVLNASETGYYLTDEDYGLPLLDSIFSSMDCGDGANGIWSVLINARTHAINSVYTDLQAAMMKLYDKTIQPFNGLVGQRKSTATKNLSKAFAGHLIQPVPIKDAAFIVTHVHVGVNTAGNMDISFRSNDPDFTTVTETVNVTTPGRFQRFELTDPVRLDLWTKNIESSCCSSCGLRYTVSYPVADGLKPLNNAFSCCGGSNAEWKKYMTVGGFESDDVPGLLDDCGYSCNSYAQGLVLEGYMTCDNLQWLCELEELNGYDVRDVLARTQQFKATVFLAQHILDSTNINIWTTLHREALYGKRNHSQSVYERNVLWLAQNLPPNATGCYKCKPSKIQRRSF